MSAHDSDDDDLMAHPHVHAEEGESWLVSYADMMTLLVGFFVILMSLSQIDEEKFEVVKKSAAKAMGGEYKEPNQEFADKVKEEIKKMGLGDQVEVKHTPFGVEISFQGAVFFEPGSADIREEAQKTILTLMPLLKSEANNYGILVEGHTDDVPVAEGALYRNNWELSSIRATRVLSTFETSGFDQKKLTAVGYGDTRPLQPNRTAEGQPIAENRNKNRRVVIKLLKPRESLAGEAEKSQLETAP